MRNLCEPAIAKFRDHQADEMYGTKDSERALGGAFLVPTVEPAPKLGRRVWMRVIASSGADQPKAEPGLRFDHVSVSLSHRCPTWDEMDYVRKLFFKPEEICFQLHMPPAENISLHPYCLHIWRAIDAALPLPDPYLVGFQLPRVAGDTALKA